MHFLIPISLLRFMMGGERNCACGRKASVKELPYSGYCIPSEDMAFEMTDFVDSDAEHLFLNSVGLMLFREFLG